jgi:D-glycero-D-manno-heptose 1,7-bisphosphate phosphatase
VERALEGAVRVTRSPGATERARYDSRVTDRRGTADWSDVKTVFLDRDGVLNRKAPEGEYVARWEEFEILDGVDQALGRLHRAGVRAVVVTNQRGIALGRYSAADVASIHAKFQAKLASAGGHVAAFYICPHDHGECNCRKPLPGLFEQAVADFPGISARTSVMIGDSQVDMEFGKRLGMRTILIENAGQPPEDGKAGEMADLRCSSLAEAVNAILGRF